MTRKLTGYTGVLRGIAPFIAVLTVTIALVALAQTRGADQASGKSPAASRNVGGPLLAQERPLLPGGASAERAPVVRSPGDRLGADPMVSGAPFFLPPVFYDPKGGGFGAVAIADVNGDGKPDLLVANNSCFNCANGSVAVLLGNGDGTFQPAVTYDSGAAGTDKVVVADVNGDSKLDLVVGNACGGCSSGGVAVLLGNGDGTFQPVATYDAGFGGADSIAVADLNGDGNLDVVALRSCDGPL